MNEVMYLIDNNVLSHLSPAQRTRAFFHTHCRIPSEVLHEADGWLTMHSRTSSTRPQRMCWASSGQSWPQCLKTKPRL